MFNYSCGDMAEWVTSVLLCGMVFRVGFALVGWRRASGMPWGNTYLICCKNVFSLIFLAVCWQTGPGASTGCSAIAPLASTPLLYIALFLWLIICWNKTNKQQTYSHIQLATQVLCSGNATHYTEPVYLYMVELQLPTSSYYLHPVVCVWALGVAIRTI